MIDLTCASHDIERAAYLLRRLANAETVKVGAGRSTDAEHLFAIAGKAPVSSKWRPQVLDRDGHACLMCDSTRQLQAHHILPKALYPLRASDVGNGSTLCARCHLIIVHGGNTFDLTHWQRFVKPIAFLISYKTKGSELDGSDTNPKTGS